MRFPRIFRFVVLVIIIIVTLWTLTSKTSSPSESFRQYSQSILEQVPVHHGKENATFVTLARNQELNGLLPAMMEVEDRFNHLHHYDWIFLNDEEFSEEFKEKVTFVASGEVKFGLIPNSMWGYPSFIDQEKAAETRENMKNIIYGASESYRHMCRFESGFFWRHPLLDDYKYYWRVEPDIHLLCDIPTDPFKFLRENKKRYGFAISIHEFLATIPTLWDSVKRFMDKYPQYIHPHNAMDFVSNDQGETYNLCHFWSNFEIADLDFWRSEAYTTFFDFLDHEGGFFYERWGDAPVHSIAAALFLDRDEIHWFSNMGYYHVPYQNCPEDPFVREELNCACPDNPILPEGFRENFAFKGYSCTTRWCKVMGLPVPDYAPDQ